MGKETFIGGDYLETTGGDNLNYGQQGIVNNGAQVVQDGKQNGVLYGTNKTPAARTKPQLIYDVVMFVAGTTDPINTTGAKHQANKDYWRPGSEEDKSKQNFWSQVKALKTQYLNLHIEDEFFSWSGDNDTNERNLAADRLLDLLLRVYPYWKNFEVHLHLIGHSHGGNVINQFTTLIASSAKYPKPWRIKSITYLSTPFFQKKHQLNHSKLHEKCKIINVHNAYDLTQQLVADFSLVNLEVFLREFHMDKFQKGLNTLKSVNTDAFEPLGSLYVGDKKEGPLIWQETAKALLGINQLIEAFIRYIKSINLNKPALGKERDGFVSLLNRFLQWTYDACNTFSRNSSARRGGYGRSEFVHDLGLPAVLATLNSLFEIKTNEKDSYILTLLAKVFAADSGVTDSIEVTAWSPDKQAKGLDMEDVPITESDPYHSRGKKAICEKFITNTSRAVQNGNLEEVLMRLFSQFIQPSSMTVVNMACHLAELYFTGETDTQITRLRKNMDRYHTLSKKYHVELVAPHDVQTISDVMKRPGTIPYLAMVSHGLSHTQFWPKVETALRGAFSSGENKKYKTK
jgi:hypothetical protein